VNGNTHQKDRALAAAVEHLEIAIELLDRADAPGHFAANADLALQQLKEFILADRAAVRSHANERGRNIQKARTS